MNTIIISREKDMDRFVLALTIALVSASTLVTGCKDNLPQCESWAKFCATINFIKDNCKLSCNLCPQRQNVANICEHQGSKVIACPSGKTISVTLANYGRRDRTTCPTPWIRSTDCSSLVSLETVQQLCNGKQRCVLTASNAVYGDPCWGTVKYLNVQYTCD